MSDTPIATVVDFQYINLFRTPKHHYCYDAHTNAILELDKATWQKLKSGQEAAINPRQTPNKGHLEVLNQVLGEGGLEVGGRAQAMRSPWKQSQLEEELSKSLTQLTLVVSEACNLRCTYCMYGDHYPDFRKHSTLLMKSNTAKRSIDFFLERCKKDEPVSIGFYGGEPLINFDLIEFCLTYASQQYPSKHQHLGFTMTTNGTLLNSEAVDVLQEYNVMLAISLDGPKDIHDHNRIASDGSGSFNKIVRNLRYLKEKYPEFYQHNLMFSVVLAPETDLFRVYQLFNSENGLFHNQPVLVSFIRPYSTTVFETLGTATSVGMEKIETRFIEKAKLGTLSNDYFLRDLIGRPLSVIHKRKHWNGFSDIIPPNGICLPGRRKILVEPGGDIKFCERIGTDKNIGNIRSGFDYAKVWDSIQEYIEISEEDCLSCWAVRLCRLCFAHAYQGEISLDQKREVCFGNRENISGDLQLYCRALEQNPSALDFINNNLSEN